MAIRRAMLRVIDTAAAARLAALESLVAEAVGSEQLTQAVIDRQTHLENMANGLGQQLSAAQQQGAALAEQSASAEALLTALGHKSDAVDVKVTLVADQAQSLANVAQQLTTAMAQADDVHAALARATADLATSEGQAHAALAKSVADLTKAEADARGVIAKSVADLAAQRVYLRRASAPVPAVATVLGSVSLDVALTWTEGAFPDGVTPYVVPPALTTANALLLGKAGARVKSFSASGCVVTVTTTAVLSAGAMTIDVLAYGGR